MNNSPDQEYLVDCSTLKAAELRRRYPAEANTHRNMLHRTNTQGRTVHPDFLVFRTFLENVGPRPCSGATLDRIDNSDPEYAPGKVRWADKRTQNSNKGDTLLFHYSRTGDTYTVSRLAKLRNVSPSAIRKRRERGWTDDEIIEGKQTVPVNVSRPAPTFARTAGGHRYSSPEVKREKTDNEIMWDRRKQSVAEIRMTEGVEYCVCSYETVRETAAEFGIPPNPEAYDRGFAEWWAIYRPHLIRENLPEWAQKKIADLEASGRIPKQPRLQSHERDTL